MKKEYTSPCLEITTISNDDIITLSATGTQSNFTSYTNDNVSQLGLTR